jgi:phosphoglycolate phosphatase-like HAD superfamily hydrolase
VDNVGERLGQPVADGLGSPRSATESAPARAVLVACDWNGTLVDDADRACAATNDVLARFNLPPLELPEFLVAFRLPLAPFFHGLGVPEAVAERSALAWSRRLVARPTRLARGAETFLAGAKQRGVSVGVVSAAATDAVERDADALGVRPLLAFITGGAVAKRDVLGPLVAAGGPVLYVGDTEYDMTEALAAGATPIGFGRGYRPAAALLGAGAVAIVDDLAELLLWLAGTAAPTDVP